MTTAEAGLYSSEFSVFARPSSQRRAVAASGDAVIL